MLKDCGRSGHIVAGDKLGKIGLGIYRGERMRNKRRKRDSVCV